MSAGFDRLHAVLQHHIVNSLGWRSLRPLQEEAVPALLDGEHALLLAPTAGGKTEAAFFPVLSRMLDEEWRDLSALYLCPIKALLNNLERRLAGYGAWVGRRVALWHGDVGEAQREAIRSDPPDVLLTTPESLEVLLTSGRTDRARMFGGVRAVIVDELHAFAGDDRGWHLLCVLERIGKLARGPVQRVGLSATIGNPQELLDWLAGARAEPRRVIAPVAGTLARPEIRLDHVESVANAALVISRLHRGEKRLVFVDSRARVEELASGLRGHGVQTYVSHSSVSLDERRRAEAAFAQGSDCVIVATSTLELGIDVGDLDRVIQLDAPGTVASFLQRLGRTGRRDGTTRNCLFLTTSEDAFLRACGLLALWGSGFVEPIVPPALPYHVFAQQLMALALQTGGLGRQDWRVWLGGLPCFAAMGGATDAIVDHMLSTAILHEDQGLLWFGREGERQFGYRHFLELYSVFDTPPLFTVWHGRSELGQVHESTFSGPQDEDVILSLGGRSWRLTHLDRDAHRAFVEPYQGKGRSRWKGGSRGIGFEHARAIRRVLAGTDVPGLLSKRAIETLAVLRGEFWWVDDRSSVVLEHPDGLRQWWTFAGQRVNAQLLGRSRVGHGRPGLRDDLAIPLGSEVDVDRVREMCRQDGGGERGRAGLREVRRLRSVRDAGGDACGSDCGAGGDGAPVAGAVSGAQARSGGVTPS
jgi:ATP-dependent Lhr-like helicase